MDYAEKEHEVGNTSMRYFRWIWQKFAILITLGAVGLFGYQNCAEVQFLSPEEALNQSTDLKTRIITLRPSTLVNEPSVPAKILLVVDNSKSMQGTHAKLRASLRSLLLPLSTHPVSIKIITTSAVASVTDLEEQGWSVKSTTLGPKTAVTADWRTRFKMVEGDHFAKGYDVYYTLNAKNRYEIAAEDPQFEAKIEEVKNRILTISELTAGSDREQPLCNTLLALYDRGPHRFFNVGDKGAVIVISDEDDSSRWQTHDTGEIRRDCRNRYTYGSIGNPDVPKSKRADYGMGLWRVRYQAAFDKLNDGIPEPATAGDNGGIKVLLSERAMVAGKAEGDTIECSPAQAERALSEAKRYNPAPMNINLRLVSCKVQSSWSALYGFGGVTEDRCTKPFAINNVTYQNLSDYYERSRSTLMVPSTCKRTISTIAGYKDFSQFYIDGATDPNILGAGSVPNSEHGESIKRAVIVRASELFEKDAFIHSAIVHKDPTCVGANQSIAKRYLTFGADSMFKSTFHTISKCETSFDKALTDLSTQIKYAVENLIPLPGLEAGETVLSIERIRGTERLALSESDYAVNRLGLNSSIQFKIGVLEPNDTIEITLRIGLESE